MYVRVTTARMKAGAEEQAARIWQDDVGPQLRALQGFRAVYAAFDSATNETVSIVCYDSEADARAVIDSGEYGRILARFGDVLEGQPTRRGYDVIYHTAPDAPAG